MERLIVELAFRAALIAAAAAVVLRVLRITTAAAQHAVWTGVLVVMLALPAWISWGPKAALPVLPARGGPAVLMNAASATTADSASNAPVRTGVSGRASVPRESGSAWNWGGMKSRDLIWTGVYLLGAGVLMLRLAIGTIRANRLTSASCVVPVTVGLFRLRIVLPECWKEWPQAKLAAVLTHERAHARRRDPLVQLLARGYMVMKGYDGEPEATAEAVDADGWLHTGDLAVMRRDGYFRITGRARDMIIRGGENVYPREIEEFLYTHSAIADAQVIGIPDDRLGEIVVAWIRLKADATPDEEEIRAFCRARLAYYKVPEHIRFVDAYPMTLSGKVQKFKMREFEIATRGLAEIATRQTA